MTNFKKSILYAIIPALIAGLFSISPKLYDLITEKKAELTYKITDGPALEDGNFFKKIYSINILNNGKKSLTNIQAELLTDGKIEKTQILDLSGLKPAINEKDNALLIQIAKIHPTESLGISAMLQIPEKSKTIKFNLRSDEVVGMQSDPTDEKEDKSRKKDILGAILSSLSVFIMIFLVSKDRMPFFKNLILERDAEREDELYYIATKLNIPDLKDEIYRANNNLSYLRTSDFILQKGNSDDGQKIKCITALKCLLLINYMAPLSKTIIIRNLKELDPDIEEKTINEIREISKKISGSIELRDEIDKLIAN